MFSEIAWKSKVSPTYFENVPEFFQSVSGSEKSVPGCVKSVPGWVTFSKVSPRESRQKMLHFRSMIKSEGGNYYAPFYYSCVLQKNEKIILCLFFPNFFWLLSCTIKFLFNRTFRVSEFWIHWTCPQILKKFCNNLWKKFPLQVWNLVRTLGAMLSLIFSKSQVFSFILIWNPIGTWSGYNSFPI